MKFLVGCKANLQGTKQLQAEQEGKETMMRQGGQGHQICLWETEEEGEGRHLWSYTETVRTSEAQERMETPRMQGLTWRLSCARSRTYTLMSCGLHRGEHAESLSPEVKEGTKACDMIHMVTLYPGHRGMKG